MFFFTLGAGKLVPIRELVETRAKFSGREITTETAQTRYSSYYPSDVAPEEGVHTLHSL